MHMKLILIVYACMHWYNWLGFFKIKSEAFNSQSLYCHSQWKVDKVQMYMCLKWWKSVIVNGVLHTAVQLQLYGLKNLVIQITTTLQEFTFVLQNSVSLTVDGSSLFSSKNKTSSSIDPPVCPHYLWHKTSPITYGRLLLTKFEKTSRFLALLVFNFFYEQVVVISA